MNKFVSKFAEQIEKYMAFRQSLGFSDHHAKDLKRFDAYCAQFQPNTVELTKDVVCGWFDYELRSSDRNLPARCAAIRSFAKFVGKESYRLPVDCVPKRKPFIPLYHDRQGIVYFLLQ